MALAADYYVGAAALSTIGTWLGYAGIGLSLWSAYDNISTGQYDQLGFDAGGFLVSRTLLRQARRFAKPKETPLDWSIVSKKTGETRVQHVIAQHGNMNLQKQVQGVFYGEPVGAIDDAWAIGQRLGIKPVRVGSVDIYVVPRPNSGYAGGFSGQLQNLDTVTIITQGGTNKIITGFPGNGLPLPKP